MHSAMATFMLCFISRCGIPVVIMGETGCGKTRLIRFMCNLASQGSGHRNMLTLKVVCFIMAQYFV